MPPSRAKSVPRTFMRVFASGEAMRRSFCAAPAHGVAHFLPLHSHGYLRTEPRVILTETTCRYAERAFELRCEPSQVSMDNRSRLRG